MNTTSTLNPKFGNNPWLLEDGTSFAHLTFKEFVQLCEQDRLDEIKWLSDMWQSAKKGFTSGYKSWNPDDTEEDKALRAQGKDPYYEKYKATALDALNKTKSFLGSLSDLGIDPVMVATLIGVGSVGGPAAIPLAAMMYWARKTIMKPVMGVAGDIFDKGVEFAKNIGKKKYPEPVLGTFSDSVYYSKQNLINEWVFSHNYNNYSLYKFIVNEGYTNVSFDEWVANPDYEILQEGKVLDFLAGLAGKGVGYVTGMLTSTAKKAYSLLTRGLPDLVKWAYQNKLAIAKAAYLMTIGYFIGQGVTKLTNKVVEQGMAAVQAAGQKTGLIPPDDVAKLNSELHIPEKPMDADFDAANQGDISGMAGSDQDLAAANVDSASADFARANQSDISGMDATQRDLNLQRGEDIYKTFKGGLSNFKQQADDLVKNIGNADRDAVKIMQIAQDKETAKELLNRVVDAGEKFGKPYVDALQKNLKSFFSSPESPGPQAPEAPVYQQPVYQQPVYQEPVRGPGLFGRQGYGQRELVPGQLIRNAGRRVLNILPANRR